LLFLSAPLVAQKSGGEGQLRSITTHYYTDYLALNPLAATSRGAKGYDDKMEMNISDAYISSAIQFNSRYLDSLKKVNIEGLPEADKLTAQIFRFLLYRDLDGLRRGMTTSK